MITKEDCVLGTRVALPILRKGETVSGCPYYHGYVAGEYSILDNKECVIVRLDRGGVHEYLLSALELEKDILVNEALIKAKYTQAEQAWEGMKPEIIKRTKEASALLTQVYNLIELYAKHLYDIDRDDPLSQALAKTSQILNDINNT